MANLENLYRQVIMDNYKNPKNKGLIENEDYKQIHLNNPSCGDHIYLSAKIIDQKIIDIRHDGKGCSICCSSASVMSELLKGKTTTNAKKLIKDFFELVVGNDVENEEDLDEALAYKNVSQFPARIKCATLSWKALEKSLIEEEKK